MTMTRNNTDGDTEEELRRAFELALVDALRADKPTAAVLEVARKSLEDHRAHRRWMTEQQALSAAGTAAHVPVVPEASSEASTEAQAPSAPRVVNGVDLSKLPFPSAVKRRGVEHPPAKTTETATAEAKDWTGLNSVPFLSPDH